MTAVTWHAPRPRSQGRSYLPYAVQTVRTGMPLLAADMIALAAGLLLAAMVTTLVYPGSHLLSLPKQSLALGAMVLVIYPLFGLYPGAGLNPVRELRQLTLATTLAYLLLTIVNVIFGKLSGRETTLLAVGLAMSIVLVPVVRTAARSALGRCRWWGRRALVVGGVRQAARVYDALHAQRGLGLRPVGIMAELSQHWGEDGVNGHCYLGPPEDLEALARKHRAFWAIVVASDYSAAELPVIVDHCLRSVPNLLLVLDVNVVPGLWSRMLDCAGQPGLHVQQLLLCPLPRLIKRIMDLVLVGLCAPFLLLLIGCIGAAIKLCSAGPAFYQHVRIGRDGRRIRVWKFRTMVPNANELLEDCLAKDPKLREQWERTHKLTNDPRIIKGLGIFLRRYSLDELPQLWNVLKGEMSLVGPRPIVDSEICKYAESFELYVKVLPGITGLWQISGRNNTTYPERVQLDDYYVRNWSPWLDLYILTRTLKTAVRGEGAY